MTNGYPAELVDALCGSIELAQRGKANKTDAYLRALGELIHAHREVATMDAWEALAMCAWSEGADRERLDYDRIMAERFFAGTAVAVAEGAAQASRPKAEA